MRIQHTSRIAVLAGIVALVVSCSKYEDPPKTGLDDRLTNPYCNDPRAINYNRGFPGKPDNAVCIFPVDSFLGTWLLTDSMFRPNGDTIGVQQKTLSFVATEDSVLRHIAMNGWCNNGLAVYLTANKYSFAHVDTLLEGSAGQLNCGSGADTLSGNLRLNADTAIATPGTLMLEFTVSGSEGTVIHRGRAVKQ
jgi:hypothetical protein